MSDADKETWPSWEVLLAERSRLSRDTLVTALESRFHGLRIDATRDLDTTIEVLARRPRFSSVVVDWRLLGVRPLRNLERIVRYARRAGVVVLADEIADDMVEPLCKSGARGALSRDAGMIDLAECIRTVGHGETFFKLPPAENVMDRFRANHGVTPREAQVLEHYVRGASHADIAERLSISESTVRVHISRLHNKLGVRSRSEAFAFFQQGPALENVSVIPVGPIETRVSDPVVLCTPRRFGGLCHDRDDPADTGSGTSRSRTQLASGQ